jgi:hypothetical protein
MLNKSMTALSALATLFCAAWPAQAAPGEQQVNSSRTSTQAVSCLYPIPLDVDLITDLS